LAFQLVLAIFLVSGGLALGYQVLWSKYLLDFIGVSAYSYAIVLGAFMGGLGIGSWLFGRWIDRARSPLRAYAYMELGVGLYGAFYLTLSRWAADAYARWVVFTPDHAGAGTGVWAKVAVAGLLLLPPTILMGGTFPALLRHVTVRFTLVGRRASQLYALNAAGAVFGSLAMAFVMMPVLGMAASLRVLAIGNAAIALLALALAKAGGRSGAPFAPQSEEPGRPLRTQALAPWQVRLGLGLICFEGFVAFLYEIAWTRYFGLVLGSSTYSFALMLGAFITGIALGSAILASIDERIASPMVFFGWTQLAAGVLTVLPIPLYPYVPWLFKHVSALFSASEGAFYLSELSKLVVCFLVMVPPTVFIGMSLPLVVRGLGRGADTLGCDSGMVYAWNTWGNLAGALLGGLLLLPLAGTENLLRGAALANGALAVALIAAFSPAGRWRLAALAGTGVAALALLPSVWDQRWFTISPFRRSDAPSSLQSARAVLAQRRTLFVRDDPAAHLMVTEYRDAPIPYLALAVSGKVDATSGWDMPTQALSAHIPLLLHPLPKNVLVIGLASGVTAGSALAYDVDRVDVVEIVKAMPVATRLFAGVNGDPFRDPRFHLIVDDARSYIAYAGQRYDVVISEPSNPWMAGTGSLFSRDFYRKALRVLQPDGIYLQWVQGYEIGDETLAVVMRSFREAFPFVYGFQGVSRDILLIGARRPLAPDLSEMTARLRRSGVAHQLSALGLGAPAAVLMLQRFSPATVDVMASFTDCENTDDNHFLEYRAPKDLFRDLWASMLDTLDERLVASPALLWGQLPAQNRNADLAPSLAGTLADPRLKVPQVTAAFAGAAMFLLRGFAPPGAAGAGALETLEPTPQRLAGYLAAMVRTGRVGEAAKTLTAYEPAILWSAALSPEADRFWTEQARGWATATQASRDGVTFGGFWVDLLVAGRRTDLAIRELTGWLESPSPPSPDWAILRACRIDRGALCDRAIALVLARGRNPVAENLRALRAASRPPG
jgi:predicted membrane-bound spermidine synthase